MPRYKVKPVPLGGYIYVEWDGQAFRADTETEAIGYWRDYMPLDTDEIERRGVKCIGGRPRVAYTRDVENEDAHEGAEPGDTTYDLCDVDPLNPPAGVHLFWLLGDEARGPSPSGSGHGDTT